MNGKKVDIDTIDIRYNLNSLNHDYSNLFESLIFWASTEPTNKRSIEKVKQAQNKFGSNTFSDDAFIFHSYVDSMSELDKIRFKKYLGKKDAAKWRKSPFRDTLGTIDTLKKAFCFSAMIQDIEINTFFEGYVKYCIRNDATSKINGFLCYENRNDIIERIKDPRPSVGNTIVERAYIKDIFKYEPENYLGDAIEIARFNEKNLLAKVIGSYSKDTHEFENKLLISKNSRTFDIWMNGYSENVQSYIENNIEEKSKDGAIEKAKVGFVGYYNDVQAYGGIPLKIKPVNHLVTFTFNRGIAGERINADELSDVHKLWFDSFSRAVSLQHVEFDCPSQLFFEVGIITSDHFVPITKKMKQNSVYVLRNKGNEIRTCGIEFGPNWEEVVFPTGEEDTVELDISLSVLQGLKREFPMPNWDKVEEQIEIKMVRYVHQTLHMNTALVGYCKVPFTKEELFLGLNEKIKGGLDHSGLEFIHANECGDYVDQFSDSTAWHGTAIMRLQIIDKYFGKK